jgi:hypothetical protein
MSIDWRVRAAWFVAAFAVLIVQAPALFEIGAWLGCAEEAIAQVVSAEGRRAVVAVAGGEVSVSLADRPPVGSSFRVYVCRDPLRVTLRQPNDQVRRWLFETAVGLVVGPLLFAAAARDYIYHGGGTISQYLRRVHVERVSRCETPGG